MTSSRNELGLNPSDTIQVRTIKISQTIDIGIQIVSNVKYKKIHVFYENYAQ